MKQEHSFSVQGKQRTIRTPEAFVERLLSGKQHKFRTIFRKLISIFKTKKKKHLFEKVLVSLKSKLSEEQILKVTEEFRHVLTTYNPNHGSAEYERRKL